MEVEVPRSVGRHRRLADSDSDDEAENVLTSAKASELCPVSYRLLARSKALTRLDDLSALSALDYIDLSCNKLTSLEGLNQPRLKTLNVSNNNLTDITPVYKCATLRVLNISHNRIATTDWLQHTAFASKLVALVAKDNGITVLDGLVALSSIRTLVISDNSIEDISPISRLSTLVKLSVSNNEIRKFPSFLRLQNLTELRLTHNKISSLSTDRLAALKILDLGHNNLSEIDTMPKFAPGLVSVNLRNNACSKNADVKEFLQKFCEKLEIIDGERVAGGRRKVRVNRIRKAVGFEVEKDRKYARLPTDKYLGNIQDEKLLVDVNRMKQQKENKLKEAGKEKGSTGDGEAEGEREEGTLDNAEAGEEAEGKSGKAKKRKRAEAVNSGAGDEDAMDATEFLSIALGRRRGGEEGDDGKQKDSAEGGEEGERKGKKGSGKKKKKKRRSKDSGSIKMVSDFGDGGDSQW